MNFHNYQTLKGNRSPKLVRVVFVLSGTCASCEGGLQELCRCYAEQLTLHITCRYQSAFLKFFNSKISIIHEQLTISKPHEIVPHPPSYVTSFFQLKITLLNLLLNPVHHLDPIFTALFKACMPSIISPITFIINSSTVTPVDRKPLLCDFCM